MFNKLENWVFYIFIFSIPISSRHIFWFEPFNFIEWTSIYIYATDIIFIMLVVFWAFNSRRIMVLNPDPGNQSRRFPQLRWDPFRYWVKDHNLSADTFLIIFVIVAGFSIWGALDVQTAVFQWFKLVEGVVLYFYVKNYALKRFELRHVFEVVIISATFQSIIAIAQFMTQGSLGLKYLSESPLAPAFSGIAAFLVDGTKIIRVYGTTPHSNVLALFLFIAIFIFYDSLIYHKKWWWHVFYVVILWAFFLTFSRVIVGLWGVSFILMFFLVTHNLSPRPRKPSASWRTDGSSLGPLPLLGKRIWATNSHKIFLTTICIAVTFIVVYWPYVINRSVISSDDEAVQLRILYNQESLASGQNLFGLGMGNFVPWLMTQDLHLSREIYQPVHNIYLLIYSETGIVGIALFLLFLAFLLYDFYHRLFAGWRIKKLYHIPFALVIVSILIFGLFDHYLWTIQSGRLIFFIALGFLAGAE
ncbi:MAG: hypothetical protein A2735_02100 [Candidatus Yanofskybacteria bacterium RIFCSPHIGHO2_01_FULL_41_21]|uniref:O-antigen polymerase n=1 Tax=Candidatus Yanofskybacteria bacterium RIFCSPHIGHO2_01_FULL_41_21 TaxID=1802660 RepID=A0A1F8E9K7_9BACT|nr:MAG: hypothetical protein A2735_02100 [Candidatus Yanofskybacteria bacterium RIFCSPHIGHO2_01_FULL_41_21]